MSAAGNRPPLGVVQLGDRFVGAILLDGWRMVIGPFPGPELNGQQRVLEALASGRRAKGWAILRTRDGAIVAADAPVDNPPPLSMPGAGGASPVTFPATLRRAYILDEVNAYDARRLSERDQARTVKARGGYSILPHWGADAWNQDGAELWRGHSRDEAAAILTAAGFAYNEKTGDWHRGGEA